MLTFEVIIVFLGLTGMVTALLLDKMRPGMISVLCNCTLSLFRYIDSERDVGGI